jgi:[ribosomal protein S5]-alanine N-acetyltransferase
MRVQLKRPSAGDEPRFLEAARRSRTFLSQWAPPPCTSTAYRAYIRRLGKPTHKGRFVVLRMSGELAGVINVNEIVRGAFRSAYLGYYAFVPHAGRGYMTEGLALALRWAFGTLRLHRVEANIQPGNDASRALVRRLGFRREGFSPRYLKIAGRWRDHERWALVAEDWRKLQSFTRRPAAATSASLGRQQWTRAGPRRGP